MFNLIYKRFQTATLFEKLLLVVGIAVGVVGFWLINTVYYNQPGLTWSFVIAVFIWLLLIFVVILTDSNESIKEELSVVIKEHIEETRLLREELKLMNKSSTKRKKK